MADEEICQHQGYQILAHERVPVLNEWTKKYVAHKWERKRTFSILGAGTLWQGEKTIHHGR